jgi:hypothetical protein
MAIRTPAQLKSYFETGKFPTQEQFADLIDSVRHVQAAVAMSDVSGLTAALNGLVAIAQLPTLLEAFKVRAPITGTGIANSTVQVPADMLIREIIVFTDTAATLTLRLNADVDKDQDISVVAGSPVVVVLNRYMYANEIISFVDSTEPFSFQINTY